MAAGQHGGGNNSSNSMESTDYEQGGDILKKSRSAKKKQLTRQARGAEKAAEGPPAPDNQPPTRPLTGLGPPPSAPITIAVQHGHPVRTINRQEQNRLFKRLAITHRPYIGQVEMDLRVLLSEVESYFGTNAWM